MKTEKSIKFSKSTDDIRFSTPSSRVWDPYISSFPMAFRDNILFRMISGNSKIRTAETAEKKPRVGGRTDDYKMTKKATPKTEYKG